MRILGIDYGDARVGIAITDALGITAQGLETVHYDGNDKMLLRRLDEILQNNNIGFIYKEAIDIQELKKLQENYFIFSSRKIENEEYSQADIEKYMALLEKHFYKDGVITCPYIEDGNVADHLTLIPKK